MSVAACRLGVLLGGTWRSKATRPQPTHSSPSPILHLHWSCILQGYTLGEYTMDFNVALNITTTTVANSTVPGVTSNGMTTGSEVLTLNPSAPFQRSAGKSVSAKLLGDLLSYQQAPQLDGKWLMIPTYPGGGKKKTILF
jgi:hypothetical protein